MTGALLAFCLPVNIPLWAVVLGAVFSMVVVKGLFGGLGENFLESRSGRDAPFCAPSRR